MSSNKDGNKSTRRIPFTMFSSSADGGYLTDLQDNFTSSVEINNLHTDVYGDFRHPPAQGPFSQANVGGGAHRHNRPGTRLDREEAFSIGFEEASSYLFENSSTEITPIAGAPAGTDLMFELDASGNIQPLSSPAAADAVWEVDGDGDITTAVSAAVTGKLLLVNEVGLNIQRDGYAKRPVNIRNIKNNSILTDTLPDFVSSSFTTSSFAFLSHGSTKDLYKVQITPTVGTPELIVSGANAQNIDVDPINQKVYFTDSSAERIVSSSFAGVTGTILDLSTGTWSMSTTADDVKVVPSLSKIIYSMDKSPGGGGAYRSLHTASLDGSGNGVLGNLETSNRASILGFDYSTTASRIFYRHVGMTADPEGIFSASIDGSNKGLITQIAETVHNNNSNDCLVVDEENSKIYFGGFPDAAGENIVFYYCGFDGTSSGSFSIEPGWEVTEDIRSLSYNSGSGKLYFSTTDEDSSDKDVYSVNTDGTGFAAVLTTQSTHANSDFYETYTEVPGQQLPVPATLHTKGNYANSYEVFQTAGRTLNPGAAASREYTTPTPLNRANENRTLNVAEDGTPSIGNLKDYALPELSGSSRKNVFANRFSAPGDRYTMSRGFLNPIGEEYSAYSANPFRNLDIRNTLNLRHQRHAARYGFETSATGEATVTASLHNVHKNTNKYFYNSTEIATTDASDPDAFRLSSTGNLALTASGSYLYSAALGGGGSNFRVVSSKVDKTIDRVFYWVLPDNSGSERAKLYKSQMIGFSTSHIDLIYNGYNTTSSIYAPAGLALDEDQQRVWFTHFGSELANASGSLLSYVDYSGSGKSQKLYYDIPTQGEIRTIEYNNTNERLYFWEQHPEHVTLKRLNVTASIDTIGTISGSQIFDGISYSGFIKTHDMVFDEPTNTGYVSLAMEQTPGTSASFSPGLTAIYKINSLTPNSGTFTLIHSTASVQTSTHHNTAKFAAVHATGSNKFLVFAETGNSLRSICVDPLTASAEVLSCDGVTKIQAQAQLNSDHVILGPEDEYFYTGLYWGSFPNTSSVTSSIYPAPWGGQMDMSGTYVLHWKQAMNWYTLATWDTGSATYHTDYLKVCGDGKTQNDNFFIQHAIPQSDVQYSWITASAQSKATAFSGNQKTEDEIIFNSSSIGFTSPMNNVFVDTTNNTSSFDFSGSLYSYPSWKQIRTGEMRLSRFYKENSILAAANQADIVKQFSEPAIVAKHMPLEHELAIDSTGESYTVRSAYGNVLTRHSNDDLNKIFSFSRSDEGTKYSKIKELYLTDSVLEERNPVKAFYSLTYGETVFPRSTNTFKKKIRIRGSYDEVAGTGSNGYDRRYGLQNKMYTSSTTLKRSDTTLNSQGVNDEALAFDPMKSDGLYSFRTLKDLYSKFSTTQTNGAYYYLNDLNDFDSKVPNPESLSISGDVTSSVGNTVNISTTGGPVSLSGSNLGTYYSASIDIGSAGTWNSIIGTTAPTASTSTTSVWLKPHEYATAYPRIVDFGESDFALFYDEATGSVALLRTWANGSNSYSKYHFSSGAALEYGKWYHIAATWKQGADYDNRTQPKLYINGKQIDASTIVETSSNTPSGSTPPRPFTSNNAFISNRALQDRQYNARYRNLIILNEELDSDEVSQLFVKGLTAGFSKNVGELNMDTEKPLNIQNDVTNSLAFFESNCVKISDVDVDYNERLIEQMSGKTRWYNTYDEYVHNTKGLIKEASVLPEFRISEHMDYYINDVAGNFRAKNKSYLSILGTEYSSSADSRTEINFNTQFEDDVLTTMEMENIDKIKKDHVGHSKPKRLTLKASGVKKLLPYNGFYPDTRTVQIGSLLSSSIAANIEGKGYSDSGFVKSIASPGILYNSIKAGISVPWSYYTSSVTCVSEVDEIFVNERVEEATHGKFSFETLVNLNENIPQNTPIVNAFTPSPASVADNNGVYENYFTWNGVKKPSFEMSCHNFLAESVGFFIQEQGLNSFASADETKFFNAEAGKDYYMDIVLRDESGMNKFSEYGGTILAFPIDDYDEFVPTSTNRYFTNFNPNAAETGGTAQYEDTSESTTAAYNTNYQQIGSTESPNVLFSRGGYGHSIDTCSNEDGSVKYIIVGHPGHKNLSNQYIGAAYLYKEYESLGTRKVDLLATVTGSNQDGAFKAIDTFGTMLGASVAIVSSSADDSVRIAIGEPRYRREADGSVYNAATYGGMRILKYTAAGGLQAVSSSVGNDDPIGMYPSSSLPLSNSSGDFGHEFGATVTLVTSSHGVFYSSLSTCQHNVTPGQISATGSCLSSLNLDATASLQILSLAKHTEGGSSVPAQIRRTSIVQDNLKIGSLNNASLNGSKKMKTEVFTVSGAPTMGHFIANPSIEAGSVYGRYHQIAKSISNYISGSWSSSDYEVAAFPAITNTDSGSVLGTSVDTIYDASAQTVLTFVGKPAILGSQSGSIQIYGANNSGYFSSPKGEIRNDLPFSEDPEFAYAVSVDGDSLTSARCAIGCPGTIDTSHPHVRHNQGSIKLLDWSYTTSTEVFEFTTIDRYFSKEGYNGLGITPTDYERLGPAGFGHSISLTHTSNNNTAMAIGNALSTGLGKVNYYYSKDAAHNRKMHGALFGPAIDDFKDPGYCAYTHPGFYGESIARLRFSSSQGGSVDLDTILSNVEVSEVLDVGQSVSSVSGTLQALTPNQEASKNGVGDSVNIFGKRILPQVEFNINESGLSTTPVSARAASTSQQWVIQTKQEFPVLNNSSSAYEENYSSHRNIDFDSVLDITSGSGYFEYPRSVWTSYGSAIEQEKGYFFELRESPVKTKSDGSLINLCGFTAGSKKVGTVADKKVISEAIMVIPYVDRKITTKNIRKGINIGKLDKTVEIENGKHFFRLNQSELKRQRKSKEEKGYAVSEEIQETSISQLVDGMNNYVIPPHLNFMKFKDIKPFATYFLEFEHTLEQRDLIDIWQGVMPSIAMNPETEEVEISHDFDKHNLFHGVDLPSDIKFMVFKVKKKANWNYYDITADSSDDSRFRFDFQGDGKKESVPAYNYNWPYDFFSLVERAKVDVSVTLKKDGEEE